jgi:hypothetical protein
MAAEIESYWNSLSPSCKAGKTKYTAAEKAIRTGLLDAAYGNKGKKLLDQRFSGSPFLFVKFF